MQSFYVSCRPLFVDKEIYYLATIIVTAQQLPMFLKKDFEEHCLSKPFLSWLNTWDI